MQRTAPVRWGLVGRIRIGDALLPDNGFVAADDTGARAGSAEIEAEVIADDASFNNRQTAETTARIVPILFQRPNK